ncbi:hypothetical protein BX600DRAFT_267580 [Xylariales sp. PMI_506]|nr:hypothetical protein BX600DRAFT_267580 [Xylariales sp. PMI_506]
MRVGLFVISMRGPRSDEQPVLNIYHRQVGGVHTEKVDLPESLISIFQSETLGQLRLVIVSKAGEIILSQVLAENTSTWQRGRSLNHLRTLFRYSRVAQGIYILTRRVFKFFNFSDIQSVLDSHLIFNYITFSCQASHGTL